MQSVYSQFRAAITIEALYELARERMKTEEIDGIPRVKQQVALVVTYWLEKITLGNSPQIS